jgi:hypothetical protein
MAGTGRGTRRLFEENHWRTAMPAKSEEQKAKEILRKRDRARKGLKEGMKDPDERREDRQDKIGDSALAIDIGLKRR